jgi:murein DD-endopeptidase MepM/ murein hydrolase activator NlpD
MAEKKNKKNKLVSKLTNHYRLLIINEDTYEEKFNVRLNRLNVYLWISITALLLIIGTTVLIAFTPLRTYIPGYTIPGLKKNVVKLKIKTDSLEKQLKINHYFLNQLQKVFRNEITAEEFEKEYNRRIINPDTLKLNPGKVDSLLRKEVEERERFSTTQTKKIAGLDLVNPVKGKITNPYNPDKKHYAIDIALKNNSPVKAIADGRVIFSDWTKSGGYTIIIKSPQNIISVFKHNNKLLRKEGDLVKQGEVIALSGNTGEKTSGPHLHFELWINGYPVNPADYFSFN